MTSPLGGAGWRRAPEQVSLGWVAVDHWWKSATTKPAAGGTCSVAFDQVPDTDQWLIERMIVSCTSSTATRAVHYLDRATPDQVLEGTNSGNLDFANESSPLRIMGSRQLLTVWTGASDGAVGTVRIQVTQLRRASAVYG